MIGYSISQANLEKRIEDESPGWLNKAKERTEKLRKEGCYKEKSSIWSKAKPVYMKLQGNCKCAYCERKLESVDYGKIEQDVEHFRPKGKVKNWRVPKLLSDQGINPTKVPNDDSGYYLLPYHLFNYTAACKPCNSVLKKDYFPIAGNYDLKGEDPKILLKEKPYLIYPIGDFDDAPENLICFHGASPQAVVSSGYKRERALVTIEFFKLDNGTKRKNLFIERARIIVTLHPFLEKLANGAVGTEKADSQKIVNGFTSPKAPHTNCACSFKHLFETDRAEAKAVFDKAVLLIASAS
jgi:hypothetical protein